MEIITEEQYKEFEKINKTNVKKFTLENKIFIGKVVDVYDGDTCKIVMCFKNEFMKFSMRMLGYDTPELRTKNEIEKHFGYISKEMLERLVLNKIVKVSCHNFDKYGRILCSIVVINSNSKEEINVNNFMVDKKFGYNYFGDKKKDFNDLLEYYKDTKLIDIETNNYTIEFEKYKEISLSSTESLASVSIDDVSKEKFLDTTVKTDDDNSEKCGCIIL